MGHPVIISSVPSICWEAGRWRRGQHCRSVARGGVWKSRSSATSRMGPCERTGPAPGLGQSPQHSPRWGLIRVTQKSRASHP